jgi:hypothetical protein
MECYSGGTFLDLYILPNFYQFICKNYKPLLNYHLKPDGFTSTISLLLYVSNIEFPWIDFTTIIFLAMHINLFIVSSPWYMHLYSTTIISLLL